VFICVHQWLNNKLLTRANNLLFNH